MINVNLKSRLGFDDVPLGDPESTISSTSTIRARAGAKRVEKNREMRYHLALGKTVIVTTP
jgi:hypothetical protein